MIIMAIESITGTVEALKFSSLWGFANIRRRPGDSGSSSELLIIWWIDESRGPAALFTSQLTTALAHDLEVRLTHEDDSAYIETVEVHGPATA